MKAEEIDPNTLLEGILLSLIVEQTFQSLPKELQSIYLTYKTQGKHLEVGLDVKLGFYIIERLSENEVQLLWWEYHRFKPKITMVKSISTNVNSSSDNRD